MQKANRDCPICNATGVESLHTQQFELPEGHPLADGYEIVCCQSCGFVYADTTVSQANYDRFYIELSRYEDAKTSTGGGETPFDHARLGETARQIADFLDDPSARILDVGCANGGLLQALKNLCYKNLCGLDPSPICVENTRALGLDAHTGSLFQPFPHGKFDCVVLSHTLEHVQDVQGALDWIGNMLDPNGKKLTYIETPNAVRYVDFLYAPFQDFNTEHINHFSLISLENAMRLAKFEAIETGEKTLIISKNLYYPAIYGFWKKSTTLTTPKIEPDTYLITQLTEYIRQSQAMIVSIETRLQKILSQSQQLIVWGTGQLVMKLLIETSLGKARITSFVDNNPINQGKSLHGIKILAPKELLGLDGPILITTILHQQEIANQIRQMGLPNKVIFLKE